MQKVILLNNIDYKNDVIMKLYLYWCKPRNFFVFILIYPIIQHRYQILQELCILSNIRRDISMPGYSVLRLCLVSGLYFS